MFMIYISVLFIYKYVYFQNNCIIIIENANNNEVAVFNVPLGVLARHAILFIVGMGDGGCKSRDSK